MSAENLLKSSSNVQVVLSLDDLRTLFVEWRTELDSCKATEKKEEFLTVDEAAKLLHRDRSSLWRWSKTGYLTPVKVGAKSFYRKSDIDKLLEGKA